MHVTFTGTRHGMTEAQKATIAELLALYRRQIKTVHHGDCLGADADFHVLARAAGLRVVIHPCNLRGMRAFCDCDHCEQPTVPLLRNRLMLDASPWLFATPAGPEVRRSGTWSTIRLSKKIGKTLCIVWPDGTEEWWVVPEETKDAE